MKYSITLSKTSSGNKEYFQIISQDMVTVNIVLIAEKFDLKDMRK